jgi:hemerythrin-like metal-binding protein
MAFLWKDEYALGIKVIDEQHKNFVAALGELIDVVDTPTRTKEQIEIIFSKIENYALYHFATEERYFDEFNYEGAAEHKTEHAKFKQRFEEIKNEYKEQSAEALFHFVDYLENWLLDHVTTMDRKYVACFHEHGLY